jgi:hypothetical protein
LQQPKVQELTAARNSLLDRDKGAGEHLGGVPLPWRACGGRCEGGGGAAKVGREGKFDLLPFSSLYFSPFSFLVLESRLFVNAHVTWTHG